MAVSVVEIGVVDVGVDQRRMSVEMCVRLAHRSILDVVVVVVVRMWMLVLDLVVGMVVFVAFDQVQP